MRRLQHWILAGAAAVVAALACAPGASACSLAMVDVPPTPAQEVHDADVAFTGTVESTTVLGAPGYAGTKMTVVVDRVLKGPVPTPRVELVSGLTSCSAMFEAGARVGLAMYPTTPPPWGVNVFDLVGPDAMDRLPLDRAYRPTRVTAIAARPDDQRLQLHYTARACASVLGEIRQTARSITASITIADGPRCTSGKPVDRCIALKAKRALGARAVRPESARRVAVVAAKRCPALAS